MTLWDILVGLGFSLPLGGALGAAKAIRPAPMGYALAAVAGLLLGICCAWTIWATGKAIFTRIQRRSDSDSRKEWIARVTYFSAIVWAVFGLLLAEWTSSALIRLSS